VGAGAVLLSVVARAKGRSGTLTLSSSGAATVAGLEIAFSPRRADGQLVILIRSRGGKATVTSSVAATVRVDVIGWSATGQGVVPLSW